MATRRKNWIITDTHYHHDKLVEPTQRPEDYVEKINKNWRHLVHPEDTIYHLGDVIFGNKKQLTDILSTLPGIKVLIRGNHDRFHSDTWFRGAGFTVVCNAIIVGNILLTHTPAIHVPKKPKEHINIHGHFHNCKQALWEPGRKALLTKRHYLLSIENVGYKPIILETAVEKKLILQTKKSNL